MSEQKCRKVYVPVNLDVDAEGNIRPRLIRWIDGRVYEIDRLKHKCRAASTKVGGCGIRYTVMIGGHESFLFNEDEKGLLKISYHCNSDFFYVFLRKDHRHGSFASTNHFSSSLYRKLSCPPIMTV